MVTRRVVLGSLTLGLLAAPLAAEAQPAGKIRRVGLIFTTSPLAHHGSQHAAP